jgi:hypothetical protein
LGKEIHGSEDSEIESNDLLTQCEKKDVNLETEKKLHTG